MYTSCNLQCTQYKYIFIMNIKNETSAGGIVLQKLTTNDPSTKLRVNHRLTTLWLICQHSYHKGWVFPKGLIGDTVINETMQKAALREVEEEGGVKAKITIPHPIEVSYSYRWRDSAHGKNDSHEYLVNKKVFYYLMEYISGGPANHDIEMIDAKFVSQEDVLKYLTYEKDKETFVKILQLYHTME